MLVLVTEVIEGLPPYYECGECALYFCDTFAALEKAAKGCVDVIFADPPYFLSNGGISCSGGKQVSVNKGEWDRGAGFAAKHAFNRKWIALCSEVLSPNGTIWISGTMHNIYSVGAALEEEGFKIINNITWQKTNPPPNLACTCFKHSTETVLWAKKDSKGVRHYYNYALMKALNGGKQAADVWTGGLTPPSEKTHGKHPTQKPLYLLEKILLASSKEGGIVLDPFCGSSTTGVACKRLGLKYIGIDNCEDYLKLSIARLKDTPRGTMAEIIAMARRESMTLYVDCAAHDERMMGSNPGGDGTRAHPYKTISQAAEAAIAGDEIVVADGLYREWVRPANGGRADKRITYRAEHKGMAVISGAEIVRNWTEEEGGVWQARIPNSMFNGVRNPYTTLVRGDWFIESFIAHTGEVYLNGKSLYEVTSLDAVKKPAPYLPSWDREFTTRVWYTQQDEEKDETVIYANFQGADPNKECVEINVRPACFYPEKEGLGYITLSGFTVKQAATQWAPPTAYQEGMIGPHWSKGWIIEDCEVSHSKCSGISLGKYKQKGNDNKWLEWKYKDGTQTQRDCVCLAQNEGWTKEAIGSHIIRRCDIHDCGQTGIVGHLGGVFSVIEDCRIHHIGNKQNLAGAEIGGIKMHAAIDVIYRRLHIHHCTRGLWLDWQAQGTRVTECIFHDNTLPNDYNLDKEGAMALGEDIFVEVSHGPTLIDNNVLLSDCALRICAQGIALVNNFIAGSFVAVGQGVNNGSLTLPSPRYTPYHIPHQTAVAGFMTILHGDMRFYNNVFVQKPIRTGMRAISDALKGNSWADCNITAGTAPYDDYPDEDEWKAMFDGYCGMGSESSDRYYSKLPVWTGGNAYFNGAVPCKGEECYKDTEHTVSFALAEDCTPCKATHGKEGSTAAARTVLKTDAYDYLPPSLRRQVTTDTLGMAFESEERFETPEGKRITLEANMPPPAVSM